MVNIRLMSSFSIKNLSCHMLLKHKSISEGLSSICSNFKISQMVYEYICMYYVLMSSVKNKGTHICYLRANI